MTKHRKPAKPKLTIENIGCAELRVDYGLATLYWLPEAGRLRYGGQWAPVADTIRTKRDLVSWLVARKHQFC